MTARLGVIALCGALVLSACGGAPGSDASIGEDAARMASVSVGSDTVLSPEDVAVVNVVGLDLATLAAPLSEWWSTLNDPSVKAAAWLPRADQLLADMRTTVAHIRSQLVPGRSLAVRTTFTPYLQQWDTMLEALDGVRRGVATGNESAQQKAATDYNRAVLALRRLDERRVDRVVAVYGKAETRRFLAAQGLDPTTFGL